MMLWSLVLTHYQRVTDRQTNRRTDTPPMAKLLCTIAERDKNALAFGIIYNYLKN